MANRIGNNRNNTIRGTSDDDRLFGLGGKDRLYGYESSDYLNGGSGNDILIGVDYREKRPGFGEVDTLTGGSGSDQFYLGKYNQNYYNSNFGGVAPAREDYALITDFQLGQDQIKVKGTRYGGDVDYRLGSSTINGVSGTAIYIDNPVYDELIGFVQGVSRFNLQIVEGSYFTTIKGFDLGFA